MDRKTVEEYIRKVREALNNIEVVDKSKDVEDVINLAIAYINDAEHFISRDMLLEAVEAMGIAWAYVDALLHLGKIRIKEKYKELFTV